MKNWFEYPDSIYERRKIADAVARVYRAVGIPADGTLFAECAEHDLARMPVYALLETPDDAAEFLRVVKNGESSLHFDRERGEHLEATIREHLRNGRCLVQLWGAAGKADRRVYDLSWSMLTFTRNSGNYGERRIGDGIVACRVSTDVGSGRAIHLFWFTDEKTPHTVPDKELRIIPDNELDDILDAADRPRANSGLAGAYNIPVRRKQT